MASALTVWTTVPGQALFDLSPQMVIDRPYEHPRNWARIVHADLSHPLEMFLNKGRWVILDGYHRLARYAVEKRTRVNVRLHPDEYWARVARDPTSDFTAKAY